MRAFQQVCKVWYARWRHFAVYLVICQVPFCASPRDCWHTYMQACPRLPLIRTSLHLHPRVMAQRTYKNGRVLVSDRSLNALNPVDGTLH
jgi:hypothetical protein